MHYLGRSKLCSAVARARSIVGILERRLSGLAHIKMLHMPAEENLQIAFRYTPNLTKALEEAFQATGPRTLRNSSSSAAIAPAATDKPASEAPLSASASSDSLSSSSTAILPDVELPDIALDQDITIRSAQLNDILPHLNVVNRQARYGQAAKPVPIQTNWPCRFSRICSPQQESILTLTC